VPGKVILHVAEQERLVLATYIVGELRRVFQKKIPDKAESLERYLERGEFELFTTPNNLQRASVPSIRDVNDEPVLVSAVLADVDFLITGDKDFTDIEIDRPIIHTPATFLKLSKQM
jgi:predicted nucleic acid-binding protein